MEVAQLLAACKAKNPTFVYAEHTGDLGQTVLDVRAVVGGVRVGLSAHVKVHEHDAFGAEIPFVDRRESIERQLLESALEGLEHGIGHWTQVCHKKTFRHVTRTP